MGYYLEQGESPESGIKRMAHEQVDFAIMQLQGDGEDNVDDAIHEVRKTFKQIRAIVRLVRDQIGKKTYKRENATYRDVGRLLAPLRDSHVRKATLDKIIADRKGRAMKATARSIHKKLDAEYDDIRTRLLDEGDVVVEVIDTLQEAKKRIDDWSIDANDFSAFADSIDRVYTRGVHAMEAAYANPMDADGFHEWRKRVKYLWYHTRILAPMWSDVLDSFADELHTLSNYLGDAHDFALLYQYVDQFEKYRESFGGRKLLALMDYDRAQLEKASHPLGMRIYTETSDEFVSRLAGYWEAWQTAQAITR